MSTNGTKESKPRRYGPPKEKEQHTIRIATELMELVRTQMSITDMRLTDMIERGLLLELKRQDQDLPLVTTQVRFLVDNTTKAQQLVLRRFLAFLVLGKVRPLSPVEAQLEIFIHSYLEGIEKSDGKLFPDCFGL